MKLSLKSALLGLTVAVCATSQVSAETVLRYTDGGPNRGTRATAEQFSLPARLSAYPVAISRLKFIGAARCSSGKPLCPASLPVPRIWGRSLPSIRPSK